MKTKRKTYKKLKAGDSVWKVHNLDYVSRFGDTHFFACEEYTVVEKSNKLGGSRWKNMTVKDKDGRELTLSTQHVENEEDYYSDEIRYIFFNKDSAISYIEEKIKTITELSQMAIEPLQKALESIKETQK